VNRLHLTRRDWLTLCGAAMGVPLLNAAGAASKHLQYLALDLKTRRIRRNWEITGPIPFGSLLKPFLTLAYARTHSGFPTMHCIGTPSRCWLASEHGQMTVVPAIAYSCNTYFLALASRVDRSALANVCVNYQLASPASNATPDELIGLRTGWPQEPEALVNAFAQLVGNRSEKEAHIALAGMRMCAATGTAKGLSLHAHAKTGTAPCSHTPAEEGDGYVAVAYPDDVPRVILLAQQHNTTGAHAAVVAGDLMRREFGAVRSQESIR
jgi:hypothetical protein